MRPGIRAWQRSIWHEFYLGLCSYPGRQCGTNFTFEIHRAGVGSGDHLHVNDAANVAQANAIPLALFNSGKPRA